MEGNAISAAFTALWRGLDHDQLSANIAMEILNQQQLDEIEDLIVNQYEEELV